jgi:small subunit ribosomal protein S16
MSVRLRMQRHGAKKRPFYRVVATDQRAPRDGRYIELLGTYDPMQEPPAIRLNAERVDYWLGVGAQPSDTVNALIKRLKAGNGVVDLSQTGAEETARQAKREAKKKDLEARRAAAAKAAEEAEAAKAAKAAEAAKAPAAPAEEAAGEEAAGDEESQG